MSGQLVPFGPGAQAFIAVYLLSLLLIGYLGHRARRGNTLSEFYLAGRGVGLFVLVLTLYATQYSGNTLFGFSGKTYRIGYAWIMSVHFMTAVIVFYLLFVPRLYEQARAKGFITPTDYLHERFGSRAIDLLAPLIMVVALANFLLAQLVAMGRAMEGLTGAETGTAYTVGVIVLALIIVIYETLGGFRAVAWTDAIQGLILITGFSILLVMVFMQFGSLGTATEMLLNSKDQHKVTPPQGPMLRQWGSYIVLVGLGAALYPQAIQRIYAARSAATLRRSLAVMALLPLSTTLVAVIVGITAAAHLPGLAGVSSDRILSEFCRQIQESSFLGYALVVVLFAAILAALMSTADSVLLSISSILIKDIYLRFLHHDASERHLAVLGRVISWVVVGLMVAVAIGLNQREFDQKTTLIQLLELKFEILIQVAPAFILGLRWTRLRAGPTFAGMAVGVVAALIFFLAGDFSIRNVVIMEGRLIWGVHAGLYALALNLLIAVGGSLAKKRLPGPGV